MRLTTAPLHVSRGLRMAIAALSLTAVTATCASALALRLEIGTAATAAPMQNDKPLRIPSGVMAGNVSYQKPPVYPPDAKAKHIEGAVVLHAIINKEGNVNALKVASGPEELRASAIDAVKEWRYKPYLLNGEPTAVETTVTVNYHMTK